MTYNWFTVLVDTFSVDTFDVFIEIIESFVINDLKVLIKMIKILHNIRKNRKMELLITPSAQAWYLQMKRS